MTAERPTADSQRLLADLVEETSEDLVALWLLQKWVRGSAPETLDPARVRLATLEIVDAAIESGTVIVGSFAGDNFEPWRLDGAEVRRRIESIWSDEGRTLTPIDNVWLSGRDLNYRTVK